MTIAPRPGAPFHAFNGMLTGTILHLEPKRLIVQAWRSVNFPPGALDSVLVLSRDRAQLVVTAYETGLVTPGAETTPVRQP